MENTQVAIEIFNRYATIYQERYMDQGLYADGLQHFAQNLPGANPTVLDVACGPGNIALFLSNIRPDLQVLGIDLAENMLELARQNNPRARFESMDARNIDQLNLSFSGVVLGFILPYLSKEDTADLIRKSAVKLQPEGVLYLSTMEDNYEKSGYVLPGTGEGPAVYMYFHEATYLKNMLQTNGLDLVFEDRKQYLNGKGEPVTDLILVAQKGKQVIQEV